MSEQLLSNEYPDDWNVTTVGDLAERVGSGVTPTGGSEVYKDSGVIFIRSQNVTNEGLKLNDVAFIDFDTHTKMSASSVENFDVLINITGASIGRVTYVPKGFPVANVNQHVCEIRFGAPSEAAAKFYSYILQSDIGQRQIHCLNAGGNREGLNFQQLRSFVVPEPPKDQINKIAKILSTVDNLIEKTQILIDKYTAIKQGMMADLFTRGIDMTSDDTPNSKGSKLRPSVEDAPELYKQTELGWVPKEWEVKPLGDYLSIITYGFTNPMPETEDGPWMVTAANVINGHIDYKKTRKTSLEAFNTLLTQKSKPKLGDILLTKDGTLGRLAIVDNEYLCINQSVALLRCNENANPGFLKLLLETETYYQKMLDEAGGSAIKHIYITIVDKMLLAMPVSEKEQVAIFARANAINEKIEFENRNAEKYKELKKGLMQDLLTGKVRVN